MLGMRNFSHGLRKFRMVCKLISQGLAYFHIVCEIFAPHAKCLHPMRNESLISQDLRIVLIIPLFEIPSTIDHQKPKLNQTKIKLKRKIKNKTSNNIGKLLNQK